FEPGERRRGRVQRHESSCEPAPDRARVGMLDRPRACGAKRGMIQRRFRFVDQAELNRAEDDGEQDRQRDCGFDHRNAVLAAATRDRCMLHGASVRMCRLANPNAAEPGATTKNTKSAERTEKNMSCAPP